MEQDKKLYMYVYRSILIDIFNNIYVYRAKLPTLPQLCEIYNVGRNTVRSALLELKKDGYIAMQRGACATVIFSHDDATLHQQYIQTLAETKHLIKAAFETMEYIFPYLGCLALKQATPEQMKILIDKVDSFDIDNIQNEAQLIKELFEIYEVGFSFINNPILDDLVSTILYSIYLPSFTDREAKNSKKSVKNIKATLKIILKTKQPFIIKNTIAGLCHSYGKLVNEYLEDICKAVRPHQNKKFIWAIHSDEDYLYMKVVTAIINDINNHIYKKGDYLPSISQIAEQYNVSERTSRRALETLREYHVIQTLNGIGSKVIINAFKNNTRLLKNRKIKQRVQSYCDASSLLCMINEIVIPKVMKKITHEEIETIIKTLSDSEYFSITDLYEFIYSHTNDCLYVVYKELEKYKVWGYFINLLIEINQEKVLHNKQAILNALEKRNTSLIIQLTKEITDKSINLMSNK